MRLTYRGLTMIRITGGVWLIAALPGQTFLSKRAAQRAIDQLSKEST